MRAKVISTGEIVDVYERYNDIAGEKRWEELSATYDADELDFNVPQDAPEEVTIEGYAVRWYDGEITLFQKGPTRLIASDRPFGGWSSEDGCKLFLPEKSLPSVTYENSPKKVKITITPMDQ